MMRQKLLRLVTAGVVVLGVLAVVVSSRAEVTNLSQELHNGFVLDAEPPPRVWSDKALFRFVIFTLEDINVDFTCNVDSTGWRDCNKENVEKSIPNGKKLRLWQGQFVVDDLSPGDHSVQIRASGTTMETVTWTYVKPTRKMACARLQKLYRDCSEENLSDEKSYKGFPYEWGGSYP